MKNKLQNMRILNQNILFQLMKFLKQCSSEYDEVILKVWRLIVREMTCFSSFKGIGEIDTNGSSSLEKITILRELIMNLCLSDTFHDIVTKRADKKSEYLKEKELLRAQLKKVQFKISNREHALKARKYNNNTMEQRIEKTKSIKSIAKLKELFQDNEKDKTKLESEVLELRCKIILMKEKIEVINQEIKNIDELELLGTDRNNS